MSLKKISLSAAMMIAIAITSHMNAPYTTLTYRWVGADFYVGTSSGPLDDNINWDAMTGANCSGDGKMCEVVATYSGSPSSPIGEQEIISAVKAKYDQLAGQNPTATFSDGYTFSVSNIYGVQVDFTVRLKS